MLKGLFAGSSSGSKLGTFVNPFGHAHLTRLRIEFRNTAHEENRLWRGDKPFNVYMYFSSGNGTSGEQKFQASSWGDLEKQVETFFNDMKK